ncbi:MAG: glycine betaine ABC transporter substrate-binding protein, partial [Woeseia sp.]
MLRCAQIGLLLFVGFCHASNAQTIVVGSKNFTENYLLSEIAAQLLEAKGFDVERRQGLNGTKISYEALQNGAIAVYPEYTGTITEVILAQPGLDDIEDIRAVLADRGLRFLAPLGFNNTYALAVSAAFSSNNNVHRISDLRATPNLRAAMAHEFLNRADGWPGLKQRYGLQQTTRGIEHGLSYGAINGGEIDLTAAYSTDGEVLRS